MIIDNINGYKNFNLSKIYTYKADTLNYLLQTLYRNKPYSKNNFFNKNKLKNIYSLEFECWITNYLKYNENV